MTIIFHIHCAKSSCENS